MVKPIPPRQDFPCTEHVLFTFVLSFIFVPNTEKVNKFKKQLEEEEIASRNIRKLPGY